MVKCCAPFCKVRSNSLHYFVNGERILLHPFPDDPELFVMWIVAISRQCSNRFSTSLSQKSSICSRHFHPSCFVEGTNRKVLKKRSVPSIFCDFPLNKLPRPISSTQVSPVTQNINENEQPMLGEVVLPSQKSEDKSHPTIPSSSPIVSYLKTSKPAQKRSSTPVRSYKDSGNLQKNNSIYKKQTPEASLASQVVQIGDQYYLCVETTNITKSLTSQSSPKSNLTSESSHKPKEKDAIKTESKSIIKYFRTVATQTTITSKKLKNLPQSNKNLQIRANKYKQKIDKLNQLIKRQVRVNKMMSEWLEDE